MGPRLTSGLISLFLIFPCIAQSAGNERIRHFRQAKKFAHEIHKENPYTLYCHCHYQDHKIDLNSCGYKIHKNAKRAFRLEWEHVVPAEAFGHSFPDWRGGAASCRKNGKSFQGRKCAENNTEFARIEADLYNIWPEVGELNGLRSNHSMGELGAENSKNGDFGGCRARIQDRKFEPMPPAKGRVARVYLYMDQNYPGRGIISEKNRKLFETWDKLHPVDLWECQRAKRIKKIQGNENQILKERCSSFPPLS